ADLRRDQSSRGDGAVIGGEVVLLGQVAVNVAGDSSGHGADGRASAGEQNDNHQLVGPDVIERSKPPEVCTALAAGSGLAHDGFVLACASGGTVFDGPLHARLDFADQFLDFKLALDAGY